MLKEQQPWFRVIDILQSTHHVVANRMFEALLKTWQDPKNELIFSEVNAEKVNAEEETFRFVSTESVQQIQQLYQLFVNEDVRFDSSLRDRLSNLFYKIPEIIRSKALDFAITNIEEKTKDKPIVKPWGNTYQTFSHEEALEIPEGLLKEGFDRDDNIMLPVQAKEKDKNLLISQLLQGVLRVDKTYNIFLDSKSINAFVYILKRIS